MTAVVLLRCDVFCDVLSAYGFVQAVVRVRLAPLPRRRVQEFTHQARQFGGALKRDVVDGGGQPDDLDRGRR